MGRIREFSGLVGRAGALVLALGLALWLGGCGEVVNEFYISNHTGAELTVRMAPYYLETTELLAGPLVADVRSSDRSSLTERLSFQQEEELLLHFTIPAETTVFLGISSGGNVMFSQLEVNSGDAQLVVTESDYRDYFEVHDNLIGAVVNVMNVR